MGLVPCEFWAMNYLCLGNRIQSLSCVGLVCGINLVFSRGVA